MMPFSDDAIIVQTNNKWNTTSIFQDYIWLKSYETLCQQVYMYI